MGSTCQRASLHANGHNLIWNPQTLQHPDTGEECYGAGIEYGFLLRNAAKRIPNGGKVALINLSWDGGACGFGSRSCTPMCVQVMNVNSASATTVGLVGYMPHIQVSALTKKTSKYQQAFASMQQVMTHMFVMTHICSCGHVYVVIITCYYNTDVRWIGS